jgi:hypothetical protein
MKKYLFLFFFTFFFLSSFAQTPIIKWQKCFGGSNFDGPYAIQQTVDGGYILAGLTESIDGDITGFHNGQWADLWIVKLDSNGFLQWQKCLGGRDNDVAYAILQIDDGYIIAGGTASTDGDITNNHGSDDGWIIKVDSSGTIKWQKCYGGIYDEDFIDIQQTTDGGYIAVGTTDSNNGDVSGLHGPAGNAEDWWVVKIDSGGALQWQKCLGGTGDDGAYSVRQTNDGGYILTGFTNSKDGDISGIHAGVYLDVWLVKLDNLGHIKWQKCLGGANSDLGYAMEITKDGGYIIGGATQSNDGDVSGNHNSSGNGQDYWVVKTDSLGNVQHQKCLGGSFTSEAVYSIIQTIDGGYIVSGQTASNDGDVTGSHGSYDFWIVKLDTTLNIEWEMCLGGSGSEQEPYIIQTKEGGYLVAGASASNDGEVSGNHGFFDMWIVKLSPAPLSVKNNAQPFSNEISLYPNPVEKELRIRNTKLIIKNIEIYNVLGVKVYSQSEIINPKSEIKIDVSTFTPGVYFVQLSDGTQRFVSKFVKE